MKAIIFFAFFTGYIKAQDLVYKNSNVGFNMGVNVAFGTHFQRLGLNFNLFYINDFFQSNSELRTYFNLKNLGPKKMHTELVLAQGFVFGVGEKQLFFNPFINSVSNQTKYPYALAYSYNLFFNKIKTRQQTGIISLQFNAISIIIENDILARPMFDRFRTGAFLVQYQYKDIFQTALNCTMWTGTLGNKTKGENNFPAPCYIDTTEGLYTNFSNGLLSAQFKYNTKWSQIVQANIGVDAEQVRNVMQNKLIHDVAMLPKNWFERTNCHIPMLDDKGNQYLYNPNQKIKKAKLYFNIFSNANLFY